MKKINNILVALGLATVLFSATPVNAQVDASVAPVIVVPHSQSIDYNERTLCYTVGGNLELNDIEITSNADWVTIFKGSNREVYLHVDANYNFSSRTAKITFVNAEQTVSQILTIVQAEDGSAADIPKDDEITPSSASDNTHQGSSDISLTLDGNLSTIYHSNWSGGVSASNPAILTYNFTNVERIDYVTYVPRSSSSGTNGNFGEVEVYYTLKGGTSTLYGTYNFNQSSSPSTITFDGGLLNPTQVVFRVKSGAGTFASCAEMQFRAVSNEVKNEFAIFADDVYSELRPGVTAASIDSLSNPFIKSLATKMFNNEYSTKYRVAEYSCYSSPEYLSDLWNAPGKYYDHCEGVTGINIKKGTHAIAVSGIPAQLGNVSLRVVAWYSQEIKAEKKSDGTYGDLKGGGPAVYEFTLRNGLNTIEYTGDFDGLAYICYNIYGQPDKTKYPDIKVHFINGEVNGYLNKSLSNNEMYQLCRKAPNRCIDVVGDKVHSVWEAHGEAVSDQGKSAKAYGLYQHCKTSGNATKGYIQYINLLDSLIAWEHRFLGFEKYGRVPANHTMAYVNYTYYMFQGYYGVSFIWTQQERVLNCRTLMYNDGDAIWGLSHEWGHQHQMHPYFCWGSLGEVSNNMNSYYNVQAMGYKVGGKPGDKYWENGRTKMIDDSPYSSGTVTSSARRLAYNARNSFHCDDYKKLAGFMTDSIIHPANDNAAYTWNFGGTNYSITNRMLGISHSELGGEALTPFVMLYLYASRNWRTDFSQDLYESLRRMDNDGGSDIEKTDGVDKYEYIASIQNSNKGNRYNEFRSKYPSSCWITRNYLNSGNVNKNTNTVPFILNFIRKCSRLTGYNLVPYFEQWGFLRTVSLQIGDYGTYYHHMTPQMVQEFKEDMDALGLNTLDEATVSAISNSKDMYEVEFGVTPNIPN